MFIFPLRCDLLRRQFPASLMTVTTACMPDTFCQIVSPILCYFFLCASRAHFRPDVVVVLFRTQAVLLYTGGELILISVLSLCCETWVVSHHTTLSMHWIDLYNQCFFCCGPCNLEWLFLSKTFRGSFIHSIFFCVYLVRKYFFIFIYHIKYNLKK